MTPLPDMLPSVHRRRNVLAFGRITSLADQGVGFIVCESPTSTRRLRFVQDDVKFHLFSGLRVGDRVRFVRESCPDRADREHAILVEPWPDHHGKHRFHMLAMPVGQIVRRGAA